MSRGKQDWKAQVRYPSSMVHVRPIRDTTIPTWHEHIPALDCQMPDGRRLFLTFEKVYGDSTTPMEYAKRMRLTAEALTKQANRIEAEQNGKCPGCEYPGELPHAIGDGPCKRQNVCTVPGCSHARHPELAPPKV